MLQWASGGMLFLWFTFRSGEISVGYAKLLRGVYATIALGGAALGFALDRIIIREVAALVLVSLAIVGFARRDTVLDRLATVAGFVGVVVAALSVDNPSDALWLVRLIVGAVFLGAISDAMLLGHWYLVQPGMPRKLLNQLTNVLLVIWLLEMVVLLIPTGMVSVLNGTIDDGWDGVLGWFWLACALLTGVLAWFTRAALRERSYSAVMAATGLSYLAILMGFGTDLIARALLAA